MLHFNYLSYFVSLNFSKCDYHTGKTIIISKSEKILFSSHFIALTGSSPLEQTKEFITTVYLFPNFQVDATRFTGQVLMKSSNEKVHAVEKLAQ